jgi:hypothetical protein
VKKSVCLLSMVVVFLLVVNIDAVYSNRSYLSESLITHDISLQAISWKAFDVDCSAGDTLSGFFKITMDGDLFPGDQTKYDNWLLGGIDFLILDKENFETWSQGHQVVAQYERDSIAELSWSFNVPSTGKWYVIYINDSIYIKQIEASINHTSVNNSDFELILIIVSAALVFAGLYIIKMKR